MNLSQRLARKGGLVSISSLLQPVTHAHTDLKKHQHTCDRVEKDISREKPAEHFLLTRTVFDLYKTCKGKALYEAVKTSYEHEFPYTKESFLRRFKFLQEKKSMLSKKRKFDELNNFLSSNFFKFATKSDQKKKQNVNMMQLEEMKYLKKELKCTKRKYESLEQRNCELQIALELNAENDKENRNKIQKLENDLTVSKITNEDQAEIMDELEEEQENLYFKIEKLTAKNYSVNTVKRKIKRKNKQIKNLKTEVKQKNSQTEIDLNSSLTLLCDLTNKMEKVKRRNVYERKKIQKENEELRNSITKVSVNSDHIKEVSLSLIETENEQLKDKVVQMNNELSVLEKKMSVLENPVIETFADGKYSNDLRETIMTLYSCGVSQSKMQNVIETVLRVFANKSAH